jgi:hypothetical protein
MEMDGRRRSSLRIALVSFLVLAAFALPAPLALADCLICVETNTPVDEVDETLGGTVDDTQDTVGGVVEEAGGDVQQTPGGIVDDAQETLGGVVDDVQDTVGGVVGPGNPAPLPTQDGGDGPGQAPGGGGRPGQPSPAQVDLSVTQAPGPISSQALRFAALADRGPTSGSAQLPSGIERRPIDSTGPFSSIPVGAVGFPLVLIAIVIAFLAIQSRIDRKDPKLALAPVGSEYLSFS